MTEIPTQPLPRAQGGAPGGTKADPAPARRACLGNQGGAPHAAVASLGRVYGADYGAGRRANACAVDTGDGRPPDAAFVIYRLQEAGMTLLALPHSGYTTRLKTGAMEIVRAAAESYGWSEGRVRPAIPSAARITRMDEALAWIPLIPRDKVVLRRIVGCRSLVSPITERHLFSWRRIATVVGADHKAVQRWHAQGVDLIVAALR